MKRLFLLLIGTLGISTAFAQGEAYREEELSINPYIDGSLTNPVSGDAESLVILIQGSGPTDRNGNQPMKKSDFSKKISRQLAENGIASFRYDKRIFKMDALRINEEDLRFEDFIEDAVNVLEYFRKEDRYKRIIIAGHSQGSLVGILSARERADAFISLAGAGQTLDKMIVEQVGKQAPDLKESMQESFNKLKERGKVEDYNPMLQSVFRPETQPFLASWIKYDPVEEISKLNIPVLIINGSRDLQIEPKEAEMLNAALPESKLVIIENMNHVFREIKDEDALYNFKSYSEPNRPLHPELLPVMIEFINGLNQ
ncbi:alpha/beta hydrolase family protein [Salegentibacter chungangensis]|uniref:Alpha/beta hydrolase family protein n=1 Tax=Salegentibacter chungangensis TaxID=1335724 RepID=A0ABW3NP20_9FLAO